MIAAPYAVVAFLAAALSFLVQPLVGKQLLPLVGGSPAVWNSCLVFFQAALLAGYLHANRLRSPRGHFVLLLLAGGALVLGRVLAGAWLPLGARWLPDDGAHPAFGVLMALAVAVGGPFLALAATAPLVQKWFAAAHPHANPYSLYAASNAGSFAGLIGYPLFVEPNFPLADQAALWAAGWALCVGVLALLAWRTPAAPAVAARPVDRGSILCWVALAALPAALLGACTAHLTTDVAPVPLLWVVPLGVYLLTFIVAFSAWPAGAHRKLARLVPMLLCFLAVTMLTHATEPLALVAAVHMLAFAAVALLCHGELARTKPPAEQLTAFFVWVAVGGVCGGSFVALLAPVLIAKHGTVEYPLLVACAALVRPTGWNRPRWDDLAAPIALGAVTAALVFGIPVLVGVPPKNDPAAELLDRVLRGGLIYGVPIVMAFALAWRPVRFALALGAIFLAGELDASRHGTTLEVSRNFFGTLRVTRTADGYLNLVHGTTQHGRQKIDDADRPAPRMYYHRKGPLGRLFAALPPERRGRVGVVGLGCGAMAAYADAGQNWTFFEIDPDVVRLAQDERYFTFLARCPAAWSIVVGDARRQLVRSADASFDLLVLDAFSSDAIPAHLLTREAFALYRAKLAPGGVLAFHVSNRYLDLPPLLARLAGEANLLARLDEDTATSDAETADGKAPSAWVFLSADDFGRGRLPWRDLVPAPGPIWADDFSNLLALWKKADD